MTEYPRPTKVHAIMLPGVNRVLAALYTYAWFADGAWWRIDIPPGFVWDQASIPRLVWSIVAPSDLHPAAALLHDWIYRWAGTMPGFYVWPEDDPNGGWRRPEHAMSRGEGDALFSNIIRVTGTSRVRRWPVHGIVRSLGRGAFQLADNPMDKDNTLDRYPDLQEALS